MSWIDRDTLARMPMPVGRAVGLAALSVCAGAVFGWLAAIGMGIRYLAEFGAMFGGGTGLVFAPAMIWAAWHECGAKAVAFIAPPTALAAWVGGLLTLPNGGPFVAMGLAVFVYAMASYIFGLWSRTYRLRVRRILEGACVSCGYSLVNLPREAQCPECGTTPTLHAATPPHGPPPPS